MLARFLPVHVTRVIAYLRPINPRWGDVKLRAFCKETIGMAPDGSTAFLFTNKSQDCLILFSDALGGDQVLMKKLAKGAFLLPAPPAEGGEFVTMSPKMLPRLFRSE